MPHTENGMLLARNRQPHTLHSFRKSIEILLLPIAWHNPRRNPYEVMFPVDEFSLTLFFHPFGKHIS